MARDATSRRRRIVYPLRPGQHRYGSLGESRPYKQGLTGPECPPRGAVEDYFPALQAETIRRERYPRIPPT